MNISWLWQGLIVALACSLFTYLGVRLQSFATRQKWTWLSPALQGFNTIGVAIAIGLLIWISQSLPASRPRITGDNVEQYVKQWLEGLQDTVQRLNADNQYFVFNVVTKGGNNLTIHRPKDADRFLMIDGGIAIVSPESTFVTKMSDAQRKRLLEGIGSDLARIKVGYQIAASAGNVPTGMSFILHKQLVITSDLSEQLFDDAVDAIDFGQTVTKDSFLNRVTDLMSQNAPLLPVPNSVATH